MFMLDMLDNHPRMRLSDAQLDVVLFVMKECGCHNIPSLYALRRMQKELRQNVAVSTDRHQSMKGNVFYANNLAAQVAQVLITSSKLSISA